MGEENKLNLEFPASVQANLEAVMQHLIGADNCFVLIHGHDRDRLEQFHVHDGSLPYALRTALNACGELIEQIKKENT